MKLFYKQEHLACLNNGAGLTQPIEVKEIRKNNSFQGQSTQFILVVALDEPIYYTIDNKRNGRIKPGQMLLLPANNPFQLTAAEQAKVLLLRLSGSVRFCEFYSFEQLTRETEDLFLIHEEFSAQKSYLLTANEALKSFFGGLLLCINQGLRCSSFFELKIQEFFYLLRAFFSKEELAYFFKEVLNADICFSSFVICNHRRFNTVTQLAAAANMTPWSFEKQFKKIFKMPAYKWMKQHRAKEIYRAICSERTPLKELAVRFGFSSKSSFSEFCRQNIGEPPGQLRRNVLLGRNKEQNQSNT